MEPKQRSGEGAGKVYPPKIGWWVNALMAATMVVSLAGLWSEGAWLCAIIIGAGIAALWVVLIMGVKYEVRGRMLGVRNLYMWSWLPIDKISRVKKTRGILASAAMSLDRVSIWFADRSVLKSAMPIEIAPKDRDAFIADLRAINPSITVEE